MNRWMDGQKDQRKYGWMEPANSLNEQIDGWMDAVAITWIDRW